MSPIGASTGAGLQQVIALRQQIIDRSDALKSLRDLSATVPSGNVNPAGTTTGFASSLKDAVNAVNASQNRSSAITAAYERGEVTDLAQVMLARQESGIAFEATMQVRNKLLSAYQDIMRMGV
ncbi:flagellar hook-basal body complex protein FliE [Croceicoccus sp. F390]|uniref:Flagellar hook-basal body complex protein FliE n=1 Tax=Croceicoccus esteveae TaxID=3075597 RepID=A0ABU2ZDL2_9SPHN|nr:flagellar hook-basal body complex protein FliE [Croceicoccus sp. F390]MDT0574692.1 flagellar hook-basal body complex protein FliE [Croceicoccus sp. F390]